MKRYKTIDACVAGEAVRLVIEGAPSVRGGTMEEKLSWMRKHGDALRTALMLEPRGHAGMHGALLTEPAAANAHAGVLAMNAGGFPIVSGEAVMAAVRIGMDQRLIHVDSEELRIDTPPGVLTVRLERASPPGSAGAAASKVSLTGLSGFVQSAGLPVKFGARTVPIDVAFAGEQYAIVDGESVGIPLEMSHMPEMIRAAVRLREAIRTTTHGVIFTAPGREGGHLRTATVTEGGVFRRSPGVTSTIAVMAVLDAMGILDAEQPFINESVVGTYLSGLVTKREIVNDTAVIVPAIEGEISITGYHEFVVEEGRPASARTRV